MSEAIGERLVSIVVPGASDCVLDHHRHAVAEIDAMSPSRKWGAEATVRGWRRWIKEIDPTRDNGWAFCGVELKPGEAASLPAGALIVVCDVSWAQAKWYAGRYIKPLQVKASLYAVTTDGLQSLITSVRRSWARDLVGWIETNRHDIPEKLPQLPPQRTA